MSAFFLRDVQLTLILLLVISISGFIIYPKYRLHTLIISVFCLAYFAFNFIPGEGNDLSWHYLMLDKIRNLNWSIVEKIESFSASPILLIYFYLISKLGNNGYLPAITIAIIYGVMFFILYRSSLKKNVQQGSIDYIAKNGFPTALVYIMCTMHYIYLISGIKNNLAFSIFVLGVYLELVEQKSKLLCWGLMITSVFIHPSLVLIVFARLMITLYNKYSSIFYIIICMSFPFIATLFQNILQQFALVPLVGVIIDKIGVYILEASEMQPHMMFICFLRLFLALIILIWDKNKNESNGLSIKYMKLVYTIFFITVSFSTRYIMFYRMNEILCMLLIPIIVRRADYEKFWKINYLSLIVCLGSIFILLLYVIWGGLPIVRYNF